MKLTPTQNVAVDLVILGYDKETESVKVYTPKRTVSPDKDKPALPGILLKPYETISDAVNRTLSTKTPFINETYTIQELPARINPDRDIRGHVISIPSIVLLESYDNFDNNWSTFNPNLSLCFDHSDMVTSAYYILKNNWDTHPLPLRLLSDHTTLEETKNLLSHFDPSYKKVLPSNLRKMSFVETFLEETDKYAKLDKKGRPPKLYKIKPIKGLNQ